MFLKFIKDFKLKKIINKKLLLYKPRPAAGLIKTVGILTDEQYFNDNTLLINSLTANGIKQEKIQQISFRERVKKNEDSTIPFFTHSAVSGSGTFIKPELKQFSEMPFDLLISYYDTEKPPLAIVTLQSRAGFKAGFSSVNKKLNNFMVDTTTEKPGEYIAELFKYLRILKKI